MHHNSNKGCIFDLGMFLFYAAVFGTAGYIVSRIAKHPKDFFEGAFTIAVIGGLIWWLRKK